MVKSIHVGTISALDIIRAPKGHSPIISGCGIHKDRKRDKKTRREVDKREIRWQG